MEIRIAERLIKLRKKHGFSQEILADKIGVSRQSVSKWERAEASPDTDNLIALANVYHIAIDQMLHDDNMANVQSDRLKQNICHSETQAPNIGCQKQNQAKRMLAYSPYILFPVIVNLMALWGGWWHPGFLIAFGALLLKKYFEKTANRNTDERNE